LCYYINNIMLQGLFRAGRTAAAKEIYMRMVDSGIKLEVNTYTVFLGDNGCLDEALRMFQDLLLRLFNLILLLSLL
jgi:pentatricopeptide repeat protein